MLTPRQRNQIQAALTFWNAVAETSRVHPMEHPKVRPYFEDGNSTPLIAGEIEDLITLFDLNCNPRKLVTIPSFVQSLKQQPGLSAVRLRAQAKRDNVESIRLGRDDLYGPADLIPCVRRIRERDAQMERKYRVAPKKPPATGGDKSV